MDEMLVHHRVALYSIKCISTHVYLSSSIERGSKVNKINLTPAREIPCKKVGVACCIIYGFKRGFRTS